MLSNESSALQPEYLRGTVILPNEGVSGLNSVTDQDFLRLMGTPFILHGKTIKHNHLHYAKVLLNIMGVQPRSLQRHCPSVHSRQHQLKNITKHQKEVVRYELTG